MKSPLSAIKTLKPWQIGALVSLLMASAGVTYGVYAAVISGPGTGLRAEQQLIPVQFGNLINQVSTNGSLSFPNKEKLTFDTQGTVGEVLVEEGDRVEENQPLARLDVATVTVLEEQLAQAEINFQRAQDAVGPPSDLEMARAEADVANARLAYQQTQEALDELIEGATADDLSKARSQTGLVETDLAGVQGDLKLTRKEWAGRLDAAQEALDSARISYVDTVRKWLGVEPTQEQMDMAPAVFFGSVDIDLAIVFDPAQRYEDIFLRFQVKGLPDDDPATFWDERTVYSWLTLYPGTIVSVCEDRESPLYGACIQKELDDAWDDYEQATDNMDTVLTQSAKAVANGESVVARAEDSVSLARTSLEGLMKDPDALEVGAGDKQLVVAGATLVEAEEELKQLQDGGDPLATALLHAELASAQQSLEMALVRLEGSTLRAPMSGVISLINVAAGDSAGPNVPIVEVVDTTVVEVDAIVDEIDVLFIREGATAQVTMDALPGQALQGIVSSITSTPRSQQGVVSYPIRVQVQVPDGVELLEGLSATASIVIREDRDVLLVPLNALYGTFQQPLVWVMTNGDIEERSIVLGNSDDFWIVVTQGLAEGDQVVVEAAQVATNQPGFLRGGGFAGAGGFGGRTGGGQ